MNFSFSSLIQTVVIGLFFIVGFAMYVGGQYAVATLPIMAMMSGFIITGLLVGILSKGITILEPGIGAVIISILTYFLFPTLEIRAFDFMTLSDWFVVLLNGVLLTFIGAWLGEKLQNGAVGEEELKQQMHLDWSWIIAGATLGITVSLFIVNVFGLNLVLDPVLYFIPFFITLFIVGLIVGWMSPGITIYEAGIAGFITLCFDITIVHVTFISIEILYMLIGLALGLVVSYLGGYIGEKVQAKRELAEKK